MFQRPTTRWWRYITAALILVSAGAVHQRVYNTHMAPRRAEIASVIKGCEAQKAAYAADGTPVAYIGGGGPPGFDVVRDMVLRGVIEDQPMTQGPAPKEYIDRCIAFGIAELDE